MNPLSDWLLLHDCCESINDFSKIDKKELCGGDTTGTPFL